MVDDVEPVEVTAAVVVGVGAGRLVIRGLVLWLVGGLETSVRSGLGRLGVAGGWGPVAGNGEWLVPAGTTTSGRRCSRGILT